MAHRMTLVDRLRRRLDPSDRQTLQWLAHKISAQPGLLFWRPSGTGSDGPGSDLLSKIRPHASRLREEESSASELLEVLEVTSNGERQEMIRSDDRFHSYALCQHLLQRTREVTLDDTRAGEELARCALLVAEHLDRNGYGERRVLDITARIWTEIANARRLAGDLVGAEEMFRRASAYLDESSDPLEWARYHDLRASLRRTQRRCDEAVGLRDRAIRIYRRLQQHHCMACVMVNKACDLVEGGEPEEASEVARAALEHLDPGADLRALQAAQHNLVVALLDQDLTDEATRLFSQLDSMPFDRVEARARYRHLWLEGKLATAQGRFQEAESLLRTAREHYVELELPWDLSMLSLDLAIVYLQQGRTAQVKRSLSQVIPIFRSMNLYRDELAAIALLEKALAAETISLEYLQKIQAKMAKTHRT